MSRGRSLALCNVSRRVSQIIGLQRCRRSQGDLELGDDAAEVGRLVPADDGDGGSQLVEELVGPPDRLREVGLAGPDIFGMIAVEG